AGCGGAQRACGRAARGDSRVGARVPRCGLPARALRARRDVAAVRRPRLRSPRDREPRRLEPGLLADGRPLRGPVREALRQALRAAPLPAGQLGLVGQPRGLLRPDVPRARQAGLEAGRRGHHRGLRLPDHREPDHPERMRAGLRRRTRPDVQHRRQRARDGAFRSDGSGHDRAHARQPVRSQGGPRVLRRAQALARRGLLRRGRLDLRRKARRHVRGLRDRVVLSGPSHDDGRGRCGAHQHGAPEGHRRVVSRLGPFVLVCPGRPGHLRQALWAPARRSALRVRPQVRLLARRLQPQGHRHAGGDRLGAAGQDRRLHHRPQDELPAPVGRHGAPPGHPDASRGHAGLGSELVRLPHRGQSRRARRPHGRRGVPRVAQGRHPAALRRQPRPPARVCERRASPDRRAPELRLRHGPGVLDRSLPRTGRGGARLHGRHRRRGGAHVREV
ncbi:MAG: CDP-4-dehydro-6-deoxy-D-glucose 3-dehydratase, partial [uncultured Solirubrobacteraceae bacterium]